MPEIRFITWSIQQILQTIDNVSNLLIRTFFHDWESVLETYIHRRWPTAPRNPTRFDFIQHSNTLKQVLNQMHMRECEIDNKDWTQKYRRLISVLQARQQIQHDLRVLPVRRGLTNLFWKIHDPTRLLWVYRPVLFNGYR